LRPLHGCRFCAGVVGAFARVPVSRGVRLDLRGGAGLRGVRLDLGARGAVKPLRGCGLCGGCGWGTAFVVRSTFVGLVWWGLAFLASVTCAWGVGVGR
jgi:hypothetical protein